MQRDDNGMRYDTFKSGIDFPLRRVLKSKLPLTLFYCLSHETCLDDSSKLIHIDQSRFCNLFHVGKFKNV